MASTLQFPPAKLYLSPNLLGTMPEPTRLSLCCLQPKHRPTLSHQMSQARKKNMASTLQFPPAKLYLSPNLLGTMPEPTRLSLCCLQPKHRPTLSHQMSEARKKNTASTLQFPPAKLYLSPNLLGTMPEPTRLSLCCLQPKHRPTLSYQMSQARKKNMASTLQIPPAKLYLSPNLLGTMPEPTRLSLCCLQPKHRPTLSHQMSEARKKNMASKVQIPPAKLYLCLNLLEPCQNQQDCPFAAYSPSTDPH